MASVSDIEELVAGNRRTPFEQRELILGYNTAGREVIDRPSSMLIGGPTNTGKSVVGAYFCCWVIMMDGMILPVDPHCNNRNRGLTAKIQPLTPWFIREPLDFASKAKVIEQFEWLDAELLRREQPGGLQDDTKMIWLIVDEFNEFLSRLSKGERARVCTIIGNIARAGAKWGLFCLLLGHQWDLSKSGGSEIRYNVVTRVCTGGEYRQIGMVLDVDDRQQLTAIWTPPIHKGDALVRRSNYSLRRLHFPNVTRDGCTEIADLVRRVNHEFMSTPQTPVLRLEQPDNPPAAQPPPTHSCDIHAIHAPLEDGRGDENLCINRINAHKFMVSEREKAIILDEARRQLKETGKVVRKDVRANIGWANKFRGHEKIKIVLDEANIPVKTEGVTPEEWEALKATYNYRCLACGRDESEIELTRDHIVPVISGGLDVIANLQPLCRSCNSSKGAKCTDHRPNEEVKQ